MPKDHCLPVLAQALEVSASAFHAHRQKDQGQRRQEDQALSRAIVPVFTASRRTDGRPLCHGGVAPRGPTGRQEPGGPAHARARAAPRAKASVAAPNHPGQPCSPRRRELAGAGARTRAARSGVGSRPHVCRHGRRLALPGGPARRLFAPLRGLADGHDAGGCAGHPGLAKGRASPRSRPRTAAPLGSRRAVRQRGDGALCWPNKEPPRR